MMTLNFFAKGYDKFIFEFDDAFNLTGKTIWFVEKIETQEWIKTHILFTLTKDALQAKQFASEIAALTYIISNRLGDGYRPTEHEFV